MKKVVTPYEKTNAGKKDQVAEMFDNISPSYDFLNHFLSLGIDNIWRKKAIDLLRHLRPQTILDVATGTGDFAVMAMKRLKPEKIAGIDISKGMLEVGRKKISGKKLNGDIELLYGDSEDIPFGDHSFDAVTVAYGVRNFGNLPKGLSEMRRVLKPGGQAVILEFSKPKKFPVKQAFSLYFKHILPFIGKLVSKDNRAYTYLPESVDAFPEGSEFLTIFKAAGFSHVKQIILTGGICSIYQGEK